MCLNGFLNYLVHICVLSVILVLSIIQLHISSKASILFSFYETEFSQFASTIAH